MKANHNNDEVLEDLQRTVVNIVLSKNESKSQQINKQPLTDADCCKYRSVKEWKQITTTEVQEQDVRLLL